jgi:hypothetical protein
MPVRAYQGQVPHGFVQIPRDATHIGGCVEKPIRMKLQPLYDPPSGPGRGPRSR